MTIEIALLHHTRYRYDRRVKMGPQVVRLRPAPHCRTPIVAYSLRIEPEAHYVNWQQDPFGNYQARVVFPEKTDHFDVRVDLRADMAAINPFDFFLAEHAELYPFEYDAELRTDLAPYLVCGEEGEYFDAFLASISRQRRRTIEFLVDVNGAVQRRIEYLVRLEPGIQSPEETLRKGAGSCRDSAWLLARLLRRLGVASRFCSGYLVQLVSDEPELDGPDGPSADFTDLHAWCEVYLEGAGWVGLDPTSGLFAGEGHIPLAATPSPSSAAPITGALDPCEVEFDFEMTLRRARDPQRATKPYAPDQWAAIDALGSEAQKRLDRGDVRLTVGGEPTFVKDGDFDAPQWTFEALGPEKAELADALIRELRAEFAPEGVLIHGQGKWYPGEPLPRWAFTLWGRADGQALWRTPALMARPEQENRSLDAQRQDAAGTFGAQLAAELGIDADFVQPVYEDAAQIEAAVGAMPPGVDPSRFDEAAALESGMPDPERRARHRIAKALRRGLDRPAAFVLPLQPWRADGRGRRKVRWKSERWLSRSGSLRLHVGDSPAGLRLPLDALDVAPGGWMGEPLDPFASRDPLPAPEPIRQRPTDPSRPSAAHFGPGPVRTALALEVRDGILHVFLPPVDDALAFVDLLDAIECAAAALDRPVRLEGYPPPPDPRLFEIKATPDPGVIEVNVQPARNWEEQKRIVRSTYGAARAVGLTARRWGVDGKPQGSGGGAHMVLGGPSAPESPFLRRPDLLASVLRYWQRHPSLSYLFAGLFIGATSQAPRLDEGRSEALAELELALSQIPDPHGPDTPPWLVDRIFRHILTDLTGNTHRAEICIDKLYSPDGPAGRLGLVEFRAFEMPPHPEMSLTTHLLVRALIAWFWETPYTAPLIDHGPALHDRFMLSSAIEADLREVLDDLAGAGFVFDRSWFTPHLEFRFPLLGRTTVGDLDIELRAALEPWPVLGEEGTAGGVARFVDSSLERIEIVLTGELGPDRRLAVNRIPVKPQPLGLDPSGRRPVASIGVRHRTWLPPSCLHPTIGVHSPLTIEIVDIAQGRSLGGCRKHAQHPGGLNREEPPVNAREAEGRRIAMFEAIGHSPGPVALRAPIDDPARPACVDLRRAAP